MSYSLVVIDMQPSFTAANRKPVLLSVMREIKKAIQQRASIIFVEYNNYAHTRKDLISATRSYNRVFVVTKNQDNGGREILKAIDDNHLSHNIKICGVNTDACVSASVEGLVSFSKKTKVQVIADACDSGNGYRTYDAQEAGMKKMIHLPNVKIKR